MGKYSLSVVMPNYNYAQYLDCAIKSILNQSYVPLEFIIIDDCSTDNSIEIIERNFKGRPECRLVRHSQNQGILSSLKEGLEITVGTYIYHASSDDYIEPDFFSKAMALIEENGNLGLCSGLPIFFNNENVDQKTYHRYRGVSKATQIIKPEKLPKLIRDSHFSIAGVATIYRRDLMLKYGGYDASLKSACDGFLIFQIAFQHPIGYIPEYFAAVRVHNQSYSAKVMQSKKVRNELFERLIQAVKNQDEVVIEAFRKSGVLLYFGKKFLLYLLRRPKYWSFVLPILGKQFTQLKIKFFSEEIA